MRAIILLAILGTALAGTRTTNRIVGGNVTTVEEYPYMANMQWGIFGWAFSQACGGSVLTQVTILSAAHCFEDDPPSWWRVYLGTSERSGTGGEGFNVARFTMHAEYSGATLDNDIALVHLASPAVFSNRIQPVSIPSPTYNFTDGTSLFSIGWGATSFQGPASVQLRHVEVNVINQELCFDRYLYLQSQPGYARWPNITENMLCAGILDVGGKDACQGDSGGPLTYTNDPVGHIQVGITSWGFECADSFYPGVNARVSSYTDWIVANA